MKMSTSRILRKIFTSHLCSRHTTHWGKLDTQRIECSSDSQTALTILVDTFKKQEVPAHRWGPESRACWSSASWSCGGCWATAGSPGAWGCWAETSSRVTCPRHRRHTRVIPGLRASRFSRVTKSAPGFHPVSPNYITTCQLLATWQLRSS